MNLLNSLWVEKYRPQKIEDCILPKTIKNAFTDIVKNGNLPNMILCGGAGSGKTTVAKALCNELGYDFLFVNASESGNIDTIRTTLRDYASTKSFMGGMKVIILDEADHLSFASQPALRGFIEEFSSNCRFILTCNYKNRIIEPLHSRCTVIEFSIPKDESVSLKVDATKAIIKILDAESITYSKDSVLRLVKKLYPDIRKILNTLQTYSQSGTIDEGILSINKELDFDSLIKSMKEKKFTDVRSWVALNSNVDVNDIYKKLYKDLSELVLPDSVPSLVLIIADYQFKSSFVADQEINLTACIAQLMSELQFK